MTAVLTAVGVRWDSQVATVLEGSREVTIARRCADLADLLATAAAGLGSVALVSDDLRGLDLSTVEHLHSCGLRVVGLTCSGEEAAERLLRQIGVRVVLPVSSGLAALEAALLGDHGELGASTALPSAGRVAFLPDEAEATAAPGRPRPRPGLPHPPDPDLGPEPSRGRVIAVWGPTGAPGRTMVAVNVAAEVAQAGLSTLLVDADTYGGCVAQTLSLLDEAPGLAAATRAAEQGTLDLAGLARLAPEVTPGLRVLTGIPKAERWPEIRAAALERVLDLARQLAAVVVVDCGFNLEDDEELSYDTSAPRRNAATLVTIEGADVLVAVGTADPVGLQRLVRGLQEIGTIRSPRPVVVVNRVRASAVGPRPESRISDALARFAGVSEIVFIPEEQVTLDAALLAGRTLHEAAPTSPVRHAVHEVAAVVAGLAPLRVRRSRPARRDTMGS